MLQTQLTLIDNRCLIVLGLFYFFPWAYKKMSAVHVNKEAADDDRRSEQENIFLYGLFTDKNVGF